MSRIMRLIFCIVVAGLAASANADDKVRYATDGYSLGAIIVLAAEKGYFKQEGIDPILQSYAYGVDAVDAVLAGQADFGIVMDLPLVSRLSSGKLVSPAIAGTPKPGFHQLYVRSGIDAPAGLKGMSIGVAAGTAQEFVTRSYLSQNGLDPDKDVKLVSFTDLFSIVGAMKAGRLDAAWIWGEGVTTIKPDSKFKFVADDSVVNVGSSALLATSKTFATDHPELMVKSLKAMDMAAAYINSNIDDAASVVAKRLGADPAKVKQAMSDNRYALNFDVTSMNNMRSKYDFLVKAGKVKPFDFNAEFSTAALKAAVPSAEIDGQLAK